MGPEMTDLFVRYKELKKYLKAMKKQKQPGAQRDTLLQAPKAQPAQLAVQPATQCSAV